MQKWAALVRHDSRILECHGQAPRTHGRMSDRTDDIVVISESTERWDYTR